jgi:predicted membrane protein
MTTLIHSIAYNKAAVLILPRINWKIIFILEVMVISFLLIFCVFEINELTKGAYLIKDYEKEIINLSRENKNLEMSLARTNFMATIGEKTQQLGFEKVKEVKYIQILENSVAAVKQNNIR